MLSSFSRKRRTFQFSCGDKYFISAKSAIDRKSKERKKERRKEGKKLKKGCSEILEKLQKEVLIKSKEGK